MAKRPVVRNLFLVLALSLTLVLAACGGGSTPASSGALTFKSFKEVELDPSISRIFVGLFSFASSQSGTPGTLPIFKFYISEEADQDKLATEVDAAMTGAGYKFDLPTMPSATKPFKQNGSLGGSYSKANSPDYIFSLSSSAEQSSQSSLEGLKAFGVTDEAAKKFVDTLKNSKTAMFTINGVGLIKGMTSVSSGSGSTPGTATEENPNPNGVSFPFPGPNGYDSNTDAFFIQNGLLKVLTPKAYSSSLVTLYMTDDEVDKATTAMDEALTKQGWKFTHPTETKPFKGELGPNAFYAKTGEPDVFFVALPSADVVAKAADIEKAAAPFGDKTKLVIDQVKLKKTVVFVVVSNKLVQKMTS